MSNDNDNNNADRVWEILENGPKSWTANVQEDADGDCYIVFPEDLMERIGWQEGDNINWSDNGDGSFTLTKG